jgi:hypothetical protein
MSTSFKAEVWFQESALPLDLINSMKEFEEVAMLDGLYKVRHDGSGSYDLLLTKILPALALAAGPLEGEVVAGECTLRILPDGRTEVSPY